MFEKSCSLFSVARLRQKYIRPTAHAKLLIVTVCGYLLVLFACATQADQLISADNKLLRYAGRVDFANPLLPTLSWPGSAVEVRFTGTDVELMLDDQLGKNYFNVFVDGEFDKPIVIDCMRGLHSYKVVRNLSPGEHSLLIAKRTEGEEGRTGFAGLVLADESRILPLPPAPARRIEFYGDSITSGMGNEAALSAADDKLAEKNNFWAYGAITARNLNAQYRSISQSGIGIMVSWFDFTMPQFYDQLDAVGDNNSAWDFSHWTPDVVVINLFQNDSWLVDKRLKPVPDEKARINAYYKFLASLRSRYPTAYIVCTLGSMDATAKNSSWPGYIKAAVKQRQQQDKDQNIATLFFPYEGYGKHPRVQHHRQNADLLTAFIKDKMEWD